MAKRQITWFRQPSLWIVLIAGALFVTFSIAIIRELINSHQVRQQVQRLQGQVANEEHRQRQLQDLIDYLGSPTFREQEARLKLGLKKQDERVLVVPTNGSSSTDPQSPTSTTTTSPEVPRSRPAEWWNYFFGSRST